MNDTKPNDSPKIKICNKKVFEVMNESACDASETENQLNHYIL